MAAFLSTLVLFSFHLLSQSSKAITLAAAVDIKPNTLNLNMKGRWLTVYIGLPEGYNVTDINQSTIMLEDLFSPEWSNIECGMLMAKFDASTVIDYLWGQLYHMGGRRGVVDLRIAGQLIDGTQFSGSDKITIMDPIKN